jgi:tetratricopeptide (TPR) repeat protein
MFAPQDERYQHQHLLGKGGMGEVWLATDTVLNRPVAVKYMQVAALLYQDLFVNEAKILASLNHPNITAIYDAVFDRAHQRFFFVMEYVEGQPLDEVIARNGPLALETCLEIARALLNALKYAHRREVVHRDLKPGNILIADEVKLTDFGLADFASRLAFGAQYPIGTEGYMSPEQRAGLATDARTDLYAFGVVLFNMLTGGKMPIASPRAEVIPVRQLRPDAPLAIERLILRLMAEDPAERLASAEEVLNVLGTLHGAGNMTYTQRLGLLEADPKPLVGRFNELKTIYRLWGDVKALRQPRLLLLAGPAGIGKKRLMAAVLKDVASQGGAILGARCNELRSPYLPFVDMLEVIFNHGLVPLPDKEHAQSLLRQMPSLAPILQVPPPVETRDSQAAQWECFETVNAIFGQLGPTLIYLQEAAQLDLASAALLRFLRRQGRFPGLVIASLHPPPRVPVAFENFHGDDYEELELKPLARQAFGEHLNNVLGGQTSPQVVDALYPHINGNLTYAEEVVRHWLHTHSLRRNTEDEWVFASPEMAQTTPAPLLNILKRQMQEKLTEAQLQALAVAALLGEEFGFSQWLALLGGEAHLTATTDLVDRAISLPILRETKPERYIFHPPGVAEILVNLLTPPRRRLWHQRIAEQLAKTNGDPLSLAHHFVAAGAPKAAARALEKAGARVADTNVPPQAIAFYTRATELDESLEALEALGRLYREQGQVAKARQALQRALELARPQADVDAIARLTNSLAFAQWISDSYVEAYRTAASVLKMNGVSLANIAQAESHMGMVAWLMGQLNQAEQHCRRAVDLLSPAPELGNIGSAYSRLGLVYFSMGELVKAEEMFMRSLAARRALRDRWGEGYLHVNLGRIALERGDFEYASAKFGEASQLFERIESQDGLMVTRTNQGQAQTRQGQPRAALTLLEEATAIAKQIGKYSGYGLSEILIFKARAYLALNDLHRAQNALEEALKIVTAAGNQEYLAHAQLTLAQVLAQQGRDDEAQQLYQKTLALAQQVNCAAGRIQTQLHYAHLLAAQGRHKRAAALRQDAQHEAQRLGFAWR